MVRKNIFHLFPSMGEVSTMNRGQHFRPWNAQVKFCRHSSNCCHRFNRFCGRITWKLIDIKISRKFGFAKGFDFLLYEKRKFSNVYIRCILSRDFINSIRKKSKRKECRVIERLFNNQALLKFNRIDNRVAILFYERLISPRLLLLF